MMDKWVPAITINGKQEALTVDIVDKEARGLIYSETFGSRKLPRALMERYKTAKEIGYVTLPNRQAVTRRLKSIWFKWCEAAYHPYVIVEKRRGNAWYVEMDNIVFYNEGPLRVLNRPEFEQLFSSQADCIREEAEALHLWSGGRPFVYAGGEFVGLERAQLAAQLFVQIGKQALVQAMEIWQ